MNDKDSDIYRNLAHEIIIKLMDGGRIQALKLLQDHCEAAIKKLTQEKIT